MKTVMKLLVLSAVMSGLVACSSAKKDNDSILADLDKTETSSEIAVEAEASPSEDSSALIDSTETSSSSSLLEDNSSSLGTGSSGLGH